MKLNGNLRAKREIHKRGFDDFIEAAAIETQPRKCLRSSIILKFFKFQK